MTDNSFLHTTGISLAISAFFVLVNNYILYRHSCKKSSSGCHCDKSEKETTKK